MEIAPSVHAVQLRGGARGFLICEPRMTLIDAGLPGSAGRLERYARRLGRSLDELQTIVCTHAHPDHVGGVRELVADRTTEVLMHPADMAGLQVTLREAVADRSRGKLLAFLTRGPEDATPILDGDELPVLGGLRVIHTPGHTPGTICLYAPRHRLLFVGDALQVIRGRVTYASPIFSHDLPLARTSVARLAELDVETIAFSHYPPWRDRATATLQSLARRAASA